MEATVFNQAQQHILRMMSFVNDEKTMSDVRNLLKEYFAKKTDEELDRLIENGDVNADKISKWSNEHMRRSY